MFPLLAATLAVALILVAWQWRRQQRLTDTFRGLATVLAGYADPRRTPFELLQQVIGGPVAIAQGGDNHAGIFGTLGSCPCQHTYTVASILIPINAWPNPAPNPLAGWPWNAPPRAPEPWQCPAGCGLVCTDVWRGWMVVQMPNGNLQMNLHTYAQYHCKLPNDPDAGKPPRGEELPPRPGEVTS